MGIISKFTRDSLRAALEQQMQGIDQGILNRLILTGEAFVRNARNNGDYQDQTGNLRASIGYLILHNGETVQRDFPGSGEGQQAGENFAADVAQKYPSGYILICVAGMEYAGYVESTGKDVITSSSITAEDDLRKALKALASNL
ncbi:hypothetical protein Q4E40_02585 [Pontibacter sp. BT731]|uniref:hypothetical protein n=1 Tax=Pontibacter coccineus TaxID=3063328 RepID=UPI0026E1387C|nr:hypothetical protein [Pontibacter sp. BT731]MDO6388999.1 hypothetical protein [Pontibacter sp. BT731]